MTRIGIKIDGRPAEDVLTLAPVAEAAGFDEVWGCEDLGFNGGIAQVGAALARTLRIRVGLGIAPAAVRNPAYLAMEFASLERMFPGRLVAGIGHGMPGWLDQVGQLPSSLMRCLEEVTLTVGGLLQGDTVTHQGQQVRLRDVVLQFPPAAKPPISLGVRGPKGVALSRKLGAGLILAEGSTPDYIEATRATVGVDSSITVFVWSNLAAEVGPARDGVRPLVERALTNPALAAQLGDLYQSGDSERGIDALSVSGDAPACLEGIERLVAAGADSVVLQPIHGTEEDQIAHFGQHVLPSLQRSGSALTS